MKRKIEKIIERKVRELKNNFHPDKIWAEEMLLIKEVEDNYFPTFKGIYYGPTQEEGCYAFELRFSNANQYLNYMDFGEDTEIHILL